MRYVARVNPPTPKFDSLDEDCDVAFVPLEAVWPGEGFDASRRRRKADVAVGYTRFLEGDILVPKITPTFQADRTVIAHGLDGCVGAGTTELHVVRVGDRADARYLRYLLSSKPFLDEGEASMIGVAGQKRVPDDCLRNLLVPVVRLGTQWAIADYLDAETTRIDALIEKKRRMVELLDEQSREAQRRYATQGVHQTSFTESGIQWLGNIPSHWPVVRLKYYARLESGHTPSKTQPDLWENCTIPWVTLNDVGYLKDNEFIDQTTNLISPKGIAHSSARLLPVGTVVLSRDASVGRSGILSVPMATSQHYADWICGPELNPRFLWLIFTTAMQDHFDSLTDGATLLTIGMPDVKEFVVPLPPLFEQGTIVQEAEAVRNRASTIRMSLLSQIELLRERRQALIAAAVTGELRLEGDAA